MKAKGSVLGNRHFVGQSDARNGTTTYTFNNMDQIASVTTPVPGTGQAAQTTTYYFDKMGRGIGTVLPDNTTVTNILLPTDWRGQTIRLTNSKCHFSIFFGDQRL